MGPYKHIISICIWTNLLVLSVQAGTTSATTTQDKNVNQQIISTKVLDSTKPKKFTATVDLSIDSNLHSTAETSHESNFNFYLLPKYQISEKFTLSGKVGVEQKLYANQQTSVTNTQISWAHEPIALGQSDNSIDYSVAGVLPTNDDDRIKATLQGALGIAGSVAHKFAIAGHESEIKYTISGLKNFHKYERNSNREANLSERIRNIMTYNQNLTRKLSLEVVGRYQTGWTYDRVLKTKFFMSEEVALELNASTQIYLSHTNDENALMANGVDSNIKAFNSNSSVIAAGIKSTY